MSTGGLTDPGPSGCCQKDAGGEILTPTQRFLILGMRRGELGTLGMGIPLGTQPFHSGVSGSSDHIGGMNSGGPSLGTNSI